MMTERRMKQKNIQPFLLVLGMAQRECLLLRKLERVLVSAWLVMASSK